MKTGEPLFNEDGSPRMVEYRPGTSYLSTSREIEWEEKQVYLTMPAYKRDGKCGTPFWTFTRFGDTGDQFEHVVTELKSGTKIKRFKLKQNYDFDKGELVVAKTGSARASIGEYIAARYARRYCLIADEIQIFKGQSKSRDDFWQAGDEQQVDARPDRDDLQRQGSGLFYLLHRMSPEFRRLYRYDQMKKFMDEYGVNDIYITMQKARVKAGVKGFGGKAFVEHVSKREANGCMPDIVQWLLPYSTFMDLADLNIELPPAVSEFHWIPVR